jgi:hypothetical protein
MFTIYGLIRESVNYVSFFNDYVTQDTPGNRNFDSFYVKIKSVVLYPYLLE